MLCYVMLCLDYYQMLCRKLTKAYCAPCVFDLSVYNEKQ